MNDRTAAQYYFGKRVVYVYKTKSGQKENRFRVLIDLCRQSGAVSAEPMVTLAPCLPGSDLTCLLEPSEPPSELCSSPREPDPYLKFIPEHSQTMVMN